MDAIVDLVTDVQFCLERIADSQSRMRAPQSANGIKKKKDVEKKKKKMQIAAATSAAGLSEANGDQTGEAMEVDAGNLSGANGDQTGEAMEVDANLSGANGNQTGEAMEGVDGIDERPRNASRPLFDAGNRREAVRFLGQRVQRELRLEHAVNEHRLDWNGLARVCGPDSLHFFIPETHPPDEKETGLLGRLLGARSVADLARNPWSRDVDVDVAHKMGLNWRTLIEHGLTFDILLAVKCPLDRFEAVYGTLRREFDEGIGRLAAPQLRALGWDERVYTLHTAILREEARPRRSAHRAAQRKVIDV
ncbi:hypothetical protein CYMTET_47221 [Cymbomonas tetramitiformis]|uniref:Uncharacterized protein n=1 Tax=Cymbomonas tetramitiformis TaxID=36881 RepID=A0AAE0BW38_9CHLO|nr:hypothetical protein CYMTET_47221 [Cymbomonas tetramitiformis]